DIHWAFSESWMGVFGVLPIITGKDILAHSFILYFRSPVFATMFDGPMAPKGENGEKPVIKINDERISAKDFRTFLLFLYDNKSRITGDNAFALLNMAKMYDVPELFRLCEEYLTRSLTSENVVTIANSASIFHDSQILKNAAEFIVTKSDVLLNEQKYYGMNSEVFSAVLQQDKILNLKNLVLCHPGSGHTNGICRYQYCRTAIVFPTVVDLFNVMLKWGQNQCKIKNLEETPENLREICESCLPFIRFPTMTIDELSTVVYQAKVLDLSVLALILIDANNFAKNQTANESTFSKVKRIFR
uniref:BTB domain-containing protein n=1 Tax=Panagrolaimus sp. JU765 TaxID=591449 RepID=A0AC34QU23_9BILA